MIIAVTILHVIVSVGLILVVLLQTGKGAEIGAVFGGSSSTIFGSSVAGNFLTRLTTGMAIVFMVTSLALGYFAGRNPSATIFDNRTPAAATGAQPVTPAQQQSAPPATATPDSTKPAKTANP
jgi:preprotein translocase subunit SecG